MIPFGALRVEVVPDKNEHADPRIPGNVLRELGPSTVLVSTTMMYVRWSNWQRIKEFFPPPPARERTP